MSARRVATCCGLRASSRGLPPLQRPSRGLHRWSASCRCVRRLRASSARFARRNGLRRLMPDPGWLPSYAYRTQRVCASLSGSARTFVTCALRPNRGPGRRSDSRHLRPSPGSRRCSSSITSFHFPASSTGQYTASAVDPSTGSPVHRAPASSIRNGDGLSARVSDRSTSGLGVLVVSIVVLGLLACPVDPARPGCRGSTSSRPSPVPVASCCYFVWRLCRSPLEASSSYSSASAVAGWCCGSVACARSTVRSGGDPAALARGLVFTALPSLLRCVPSARSSLWFP